MQEYGREADPAEFDAAAVVLHNFLDARAQGNWAAACTFMAANVVRSFQQLAERSGKVKGASCGEIVASIVSPKAQDDLKVEAAKADIGSVRVEGDRALVMYTTTGGTVVAIPMKNEGGAWKVGSLAGIPLN